VPYGHTRFVARVDNPFFTFTRISSIAKILAVCFGQIILIERIAAGTGPFFYPTLFGVGGSNNLR
jgi:hypothetical protein